MPLGATNVLEPEGYTNLFIFVFQSEQFPAARSHHSLAFSFTQRQYNYINVTWTVEHNQVEQAMNRYGWNKDNRANECVGLGVYEWAGGLVGEQKESKQNAQYKCAGHQSK